MEDKTIRLNKLISEVGICSRREADGFILENRVSVNGKSPQVGQKVSAEDIVLVDGEQVDVEKYIRLQEERRMDERHAKELLGTVWKTNANTENANNPAKREKYGTYNKFAAARKAAKEGGWNPKPPKRTYEEQLIEDALRLASGKPLKKSEAAKQIIANPKSAALRKTSRNNPANKAKWVARRKGRNQGGKA